MLLLIALVSFFNSSLAQYTLSGRVLDSLSHEPLSFATIIFDEKNQQGVTADIQGDFQIRSTKPISQLKIKYIGYKDHLVEVSDSSSHVTILLSSGGLQLDEVLILGDQNPVETLMQQVIKNRKRNDPERTGAFFYRSYNKINYDLYLDQEALRQQDSSMQGMEAIAERTGILIMESVSERKFIFPNHDEETITATKVSGFNNPQFASLARDFQPFSFYKEIIPILDKNYINPIASGSLRRYDYIAQDTLYQPQDTVYIVLFRPKQGKNFDALTGLLYINTKNFALQNVIAKPANPGLLSMEIEQKYVWVNEEQWFPSQLNFKLFVKDYAQKNGGMQVQGQSFIKDINLQPSLRARDFSIENISMLDSAGLKDELYWHQARIDSLTQKEKNTYQFIDSLGEEIHLDQWVSQLGKLQEKKLGLKYADVMVDKLYSFNEHEGHRIGLGLSTNEIVSKHLTLGGYVGYGFRDKAVKYGGSLEVEISKPHDLVISVQYLQDVSEPGQSIFEKDRGLTNPRSYQTSRMDGVVLRQADLAFRALRYGQFRLRGLNINRTPLYDYRWLGSNTDYREGAFSQTELQVKMRYAFRERLVESLGQRVSMGSKYPVWEVSYTEGLSDLLESTFSYRKIETQLSYQFKTKSWGNTRFILRAGMAQGELPASLLFYGAGNQNDSAFLYAEDYFQTMTLYEFLSDQYGHLFIYQDFGSRLFKLPRFKPQISLVHAMGIGNLAQPEVHEGISFQTMEKGFFESGIVIRQLLRINYFNLGYMGLGIGGFYRYGPYQHTELRQNLAFKVNLSFSTD
jgi:hypothetical protein